MAFVVPYDGSALSKTALVRASEFAGAMDEAVVAVSVVPSGNRKYASEQGWIDLGEEFDAGRVESTLRAEVDALAPEATYEVEYVYRYGGVTEISKAIRRFARDNDASVVFIGSANAGRIVRSITVGQNVATDRAYDTMIVSNVDRPAIETADAVARVDR